MNLDVDFLIDFFTKNSESNNEEELDGEIGEQEGESPAASPAPSTGGGGGGNVPKWADSYQTKRGKANMLGRAGEKWNTGLARGSANQIW
jgi:hypothetical protein